MFNRGAYYSQTEVLKQFKISRKAYNKLIVDLQLPVVSKSINLGEFSVKTVYIEKEIIDKLNLQKK